MTNTQFFYWLQGFFEVHSLSTPGLFPKLNKEQADCVIRHIDLVAVDHALEPVACAIRALSELIRDEIADPQKISTRIQLKLQDQFRHVIDPAQDAGKSPAEIAAANGTHSRPDFEHLARC